jgi:hypothetical protein
MEDKTQSRDKSIIGNRRYSKIIMSQRIRYLGHGERMEDNAVPKRMLKGRLYSKRRKGDG